ncbi:uncharacterized protein [Elaeis guineensis]|uniref:uncharacterized protein n=1 Tax=Elaeis guineensis var. tenera TaxID=51953 RepID=UPI003C6CD6EB
MEEDMLFGPDFHLSHPDGTASAAADYERSEAMVHLDLLFGHNLRLSTIPDPPAAAADERSEAKVRMDAAERVILRLDTSIPGSLVGGFAGKYLSAVDDIILLAGGGVDDDVGGRAKSLLKTAMSRLRKEFGCIISGRSANLDADHRFFQSLSASMPSESSDLTSDDFTPDDFSTSMEEDQHAAEEKGWHYISDDHNYKQISSKVIPDLKEIADRMIAAGYQQELWQAYRSSRLDFLSGCLSVLEVDQSSIEHAQTIEWRDLQEKVGKWIQSLNYIVRVFLPGEMGLCNQIFEASDELKERGSERPLSALSCSCSALGKRLLQCCRRGEKYSKYWAFMTLSRMFCPTSRPCSQGIQSSFLVRWLNILSKGWEKW